MNTKQKREKDESFSMKFTWFNYIIFGAKNVNLESVVCYPYTFKIQ